MRGIGIIGAGNMGADHARRIAGEVPGARVVSVFDPDRARARAVARDVGSRMAASAAEVIDDPGVEGVIVASPTDTHRRITDACIAAGKPVLCEKPLASTPAGCLAVTRAEAAVGRRLVQVGFMRRFDPDYQRLRDAVAGGSIGRPLVVHCIHRNESAPPGFSGAMALTESLVHEIDVARWLLGQEIVAVTVTRPRPTRLEGVEEDDPLVALLEMADGTLVDAEVFVRARYGYDVRCEVVGERAFAALTPAGIGPGAVARDWRARFDTAYRRELEAFVASLDGPAGPDVASAWDGYAATAVAHACVRALGTGRREPVGRLSRPPFPG